MPSRNTIENVRAVFEAEGCQLLTDTYINQQQSLDYICPKGHKSRTTWKNWTKGCRCNVCAHVTKLTMDDVAKEFSGDGYTLLSTGVYKNTSQKLDYRCPNGHTHSINLRDWRSGYRCPYCAGSMRLTIDYVREELLKEGYSLLTEEYVNNASPLQTVCPEGHHWETTWVRWYNGNRCKTCYELRKIPSIEEVRKEFDSDGYKLLSTEYTNAHTKLDFICPNGHEHNISYSSWKRGSRCYLCKGDSNRLSYDFVKEQFEKDGYTLLSDSYTDSASYLEYRCPAGHEHSMPYSRWYGGARCPSCYGNARVPYDHVKSKMEREGYKVAGPVGETYKNNRTKIESICPNGHTYYASWFDWTSNKVRCPKCKEKGTSLQEQSLIDFIRTLDVDFEVHDRYVIAPLELDIVIPSKKIAIEYCGLYWHSELVGKSRTYHLDKLNKCSAAGYKLITIFEDELLTKFDIVKSRLATLLSVSSKTIYARKCQIKEISSSDASQFVNTNHIQGYTGSSVKLGAFHNGELVSVMTFSRPSISKGMRNQSNGVWELSRFCSLLDHRVIGVASKLMSYFKRNYEWNSIYSYADRRWSVGSVYEAIGFVSAGVTPPNYWYFEDGNTTKRVHRFALRKRSNEPKNETEWSLRQKEGLNRIWDCGNLKYTIERV